MSKVVSTASSRAGEQQACSSVNVSSIDKDQVWLWIFAAISFCADPELQLPYVAMGSSWLDGSRWFKMVQVSSI